MGLPHGGGGVQKAQEKLTGRSPCFCGAVGGATELLNNWGTAGRK